MTPLSVRFDEFSIQITSSDSKLFFVRLTDPQSLDEKAVFSDFRIDESDIELALKALDLFETKVPQINRARTWVVSDLLPVANSGSSINQPELVRRFDELKALFTAYSEGTKRFLENAYIEPRAERFDGVFVFAKEPPEVSLELRRFLRI